MESHRADGRGFYFGKALCGYQVSGHVNIMMESDKDLRESGRGYRDGEAPQDCALPIYSCAALLWRRRMEILNPCPRSCLVRSVQRATLCRLCS
jgi:hypothetical protein